MALITLDFTGLYFSTKVEVPDKDLPTTTVKTITEAAEGSTGETGGRLTMVRFSTVPDFEGFLSAAVVEHTSPPRSRQVDEAHKPQPDLELPAGMYGYVDQFVDRSGQVGFTRVPGIEISFALQWQYYVFDSSGTKLKSGPKAKSGNQFDPLKRTIVSSAESTKEVILEPNDIIRWRLIAIGGLVEAFERKRAALPEEQRLALESMIRSRRLTPRDALRQIREGMPGWEWP